MKRGGPAVPKRKPQRRGTTSRHNKLMLKIQALVVLYPPALDALEDIVQTWLTRFDRRAIPRE